MKTVAIDSGEGFYTLSTPDTVDVPVRIDRDYKENGIVVNLDGPVPIDGAGPAYKLSRQVIEAVTQAGLAEVEHELWPLASLKGG